MTGLRNGDRAVIRELYERYFAGIRTLVTQNSGSVDDARDVFQEGLMVVYTKAQSADGLRLSGSLFSFFYAVCRNIWLKRLRKTARERVTITDTEVYTTNDTPERAVIQRERETLYREKFAALGADCQRVLQLFFDGVKLRDIAAQMGYGSEQYARKRKFKCKEKLIELIRQDARYTPASDG